MGGVGVGAFGNPKNSTESSAAGTTVQHGVAVGILVSPGSGTKSDHLTPDIWDTGNDAAYGSTSSQWSATGSKLPTGGVGNQNIQNQPPGFSPTGYYIGAVNPFVRATIAGCHYAAGTNDANSVMLGYAFSPPNNGTIVTGYPFCSVHEYAVCYDPNLYYKPDSDCNTKEFSPGDGRTVFQNGQYWYYEPAPISLYPVSAISNANPMVMHCPMNQAGSPMGVGSVVSFFGIPGPMGASVNGNSYAVTAASGSNGNFIYTFGAVDSTSFGAYPGTFTISAATNSNPCNLTINDPGATHPLIDRTYFWVQGAAGGTWGTNLNKQQAMCATNLGGVPGAWTFDVINGQFSGVTFNSTSWGTYTANSGTFTVGGISAPFTTLGSTFAGNTYITPKPRRVNPISQVAIPDANGHGASADLSSNMYCAPTTPLFKRRRVEICWTQAGTVTPGYIRVWDDGVLTLFLQGRTDNASASTIYRNFGTGSVYMSSRGPMNFVQFQEVYHDWTPAGGQVFRVYAGNANTFAACTKTVPQPNLISVANLAVNLGAFWQGDLADNETVWFYAMPEAGPVGTSVQIGRSAGYSIVPVSKPSITTGASLPGGTHGVAYNSGALATTGGTGAISYYLAGAATGNGGTSAAVSANTWVVNVNTGAITCASPVAETALITIAAVDSATPTPVCGSKQFTVVIS